MASSAPTGRRKAVNAAAKTRGGTDKALRQLQDEDAPSSHPYASFTPASTHIAVCPASSLSPLSPSSLSSPPSPDSIPSPPRSIWFIYSVSLSGMLIAGTAYAYSAWSPDLKARLSLSQSQVELIGYCGNFPGLVQPFVGVLTNRYHPAVTAMLAAAFLLTGYLLMAAAVWTDSCLTSASVLAAANASVVVGITHIYTVILAVNVLNLPPHRLGLGISGCVTLYGLSASVFSLPYVYALHNNLTGYFLLSGLLSSTVCLLNAAVLRKVPRTAAATLSVSAGPHAEPPLASLLLLPPVSPQPSSRSSSSPSSLSSISFSSSPSFSSAANTPACTADTIAAPAHSSASPFPGALPSSSPPSSSPSSALDQRLTDGSFISVFLVLLHLLRLPLFYLYFAVIFLVGGCGYLIINNTGNVLQSLNDGQQDHELTFACILLLSLGNGLGRMLMAFSDVVPIRAGWFAVISGQLHCGCWHAAAATRSSCCSCCAADVDSGRCVDVL